MYYAGISDEAGEDLDIQIKAHAELGWSHIEPRNIRNTCITDLSDGQFRTVARKLRIAKLQAVGFASQIANWARPIDGDFQVDVDELNRAIPRMQEVGAKFIRCMSYPNRKDNPLPEIVWESEVMRRFKELAKIAEQGDVVLVHENCHGWASQSPQHFLKLAEAVNSPALKFVFDTGNTRDRDNLEYYEAVKEHIVHVHIKDWTRSEDGSTTSCFPGEGEAQVPEIIRRLKADGYDGCLSIEPHMVAVIHLDQSADADPEKAYNTYVEYGKRLMKLVDSIGI
jgi:sugar phosphate isomerase/epimerase